MYDGVFLTALALHEVGKAKVVTTDKELSCSKSKSWADNNRKIRGTFDTSNTHIHDRSISWLGTGISIKVAGLIFFYLLSLPSLFNKNKTPFKLNWITTLRVETSVIFNRFLWCSLSRPHFPLCNCSLYMN
jgi:hypothetical protein